MNYGHREKLRYLNGNRRKKCSISKKVPMLLFFTSSLTHVFKVQIGVPPIRDSPPPSKVCTHQKAMIKTPQIYAWISCSFCRSLPLVSQQLQQYSSHISPPFSNLKSSQKTNDHHCATFLPSFLTVFFFKTYVANVHSRDIAPLDRHKSIKPSERGFCSPFHLQEPACGASLGFVLVRDRI